MNNTHLLYMESMWQLEGEATVEAVDVIEDKTIVILDETLFYAQGGGQPFDQGVMEGTNGVFHVKEVRFVDGIVKHIGAFESGSFSVGERVQLKVEPERRALNTRLHSAGHVIDMALRRLGIAWIPFKGFHFPDGPYDEYVGQVEGDAEELRAKIEATCAEVLKDNAVTWIEFLPAGELVARGYDVPPIAPEKPLRLVHYGEEFAMPCGGTHVKELSAIGTLKIRKVKQEKDHVRVAYEVA